MARLANVLAIRARVAEPFVAEDLVGLSDVWTRHYHAFVVHVLEVLSRSIRLPATLSVSDGGIWCGAVSWRHPEASGGTPAGLSYRGIPLLPPPRLIDDAPWAASLPSDGVRILSGDDIGRLGERMSRRGTSGPPAGQTSRSSSSASAS
jgi:hypothetical protein